jgi:hypothetical protein
MIAALNAASATVTVNDVRRIRPSLMSWENLNASRANLSRITSAKN